MKAINETQNINGFDLNKGSLKDYLKYPITYRDKDNQVVEINTKTRDVFPDDILTEYKPMF